MKKLTGLVLFALMISLTACQEEAIETTENAVETNTKTVTFNENVSVQNNMLYFASVEDYENTIDYLGQIGDENFEQWENELSFDSMRKIMPEEEREKIGIEDELFATLLNENGMVHIAEHIFQVDVLDETVLVIKAKDYNKVTDLNIFNTKGIVQIFTTEDNVLDIIAGNETESEKGGCSGQKKGYYRTNTADGWVDRKVAYQKAGIYFSIIGKIQQESAYPRCDISLRTYNLDGNNYGVKNKRIHNCNDKIIFNRTWTGGYNTSYSWRPYNSTRGLKKFKWHVEFYYYDSNGNSWGPKLKISCSDTCN